MKIGFLRNSFDLHKNKKAMKMLMKLTLRFGMWVLSRSVRPGVFDHKFAIVVIGLEEAPLHRHVEKKIAALIRIFDPKQIFRIRGPRAPIGDCKGTFIIEITSDMEWGFNYLSLTRHPRPIDLHRSKVLFSCSCEERNFKTNIQKIFRQIIEESLDLCEN